MSTSKPSSYPVFRLEHISVFYAGLPHSEFTRWPGIGNLPDGAYIAYFSDNHWWWHLIKDMSVINLETKDVPGELQLWLLLNK